MFNAIFTGITAYISTSIDYLLVLMAIFSTNQNTKLKVYLGDLIGTTILVGTSLILALVLNIVPSDWILGLLGLIPIIMGLKILYDLYIKKAEDDEDDKIIVQDNLAKKRNLVFSVAIITIVTCGADNIGVYVPLFTQLSAKPLIIVLITFVFMLTIFCMLGYWLTKIPVVAEVLERFGDLITAIVYILIGIMILNEAGTLQHFLIM